MGMSSCQATLASSVRACFSLQAKNDLRLSPLALASDFGRLEVVRQLLEVGAKTEGRDYRGNTAIIHASREVSTAELAVHRTIARSRNLLPRLRRSDFEPPGKRSV